MYGVGFNLRKTQTDLAGDAMTSTIQMLGKMQHCAGGDTALQSTTSTSSDGDKSADEAESGPEGSRPRQPGQSNALSGLFHRR